MWADGLRTKLYSTGYTKGVKTRDDIRDLLRYAYAFRADLNRVIEEAEQDLAVINTPTTDDRNPF